MPPSQVATKTNAAGEEMKAAAVQAVAMRTVKANDGGVTFVEPEEGGDGFSHVKVDFVKFKVVETRFCAESGFDEKLPAISLEAKHQPLQKLTVTLGGEDFEVPTKGTDKLTCLLAKVALPAQAFLSLEYTSPYGGIRYVDKHPVEIDYGVKGAGGGNCCSLQ